MIVLDTHVVVWALGDSSELGETARQTIRSALEHGNKVGCSIVSIYEIANAVRRQRLVLSHSLDEFLAVVQKKLVVIPLTVEITIAAANLQESMHGDPLDRMIAATALVENCTLITADKKILKSGACKTVW